MAQRKTITENKKKCSDFFIVGIQKVKNGAIDEKKVVGEGHGFESGHLNADDELSITTGPL